MQRRQRIGLLVQLSLVLATVVVGLLTNLVTAGEDTGGFLRTLERLALPGLGVLLVALLVGHWVSYRLESPAKPTSAWDPERSP